MGMYSEFVGLVDNNGEKKARFGIYEDEFPVDDVDYTFQQLKTMVKDRAREGLETSSFLKGQINKALDAFKAAALQVKTELQTQVVSSVAEPIVANEKTAEPA